jgi:hypothetical protein
MDRLTKPASERKIILCDLDGTLADLMHRRHFVTAPQVRAPASLGGTIRDPNFRPNWDAFHKACVDDMPIETTVHLVESLLEADPARELWIVSGRSGKVYDETVVWLNTHLDRYDRLVMRPAGDYTKDDVLKETWLLDGTLPPLEDILCVFDDRDRVVQMWRRHGLTCYQVAEGDF